MNWKDQELVSVTGGFPLEEGSLERGSTVQLFNNNEIELKKFYELSNVYWFFAIDLSMFSFSSFAS